VIAYLLTVTLRKIVRGDLFLENAPSEKASTALDPIAGK
jgi:hypothetical protein